MSQNKEDTNINEKQRTTLKIRFNGFNSSCFICHGWGGIYDLPQNMAVHAGAIGQICAWIITGFIMWFIVKVS